MLITNTFFIFAEKVSNALQQLLLLYLLTTCLTSSQYGEFQYSLSIATIISLLFQICDEKVIKSAYLENRDKNLIYTSVLIKFVICLLCSITFIIIQYLSDKSGIRLHLIILFFFSNIILSISYSYHLLSDVNLKSYKRFFSIFSGYIITSLTILFLSRTNLQLFDAGLCVLTGSVVTLLITLLISELNSKKKFSIQKCFTYFWSIIYKSIPFALATATYVVYMRMDLIMVEYYLGLESVAIYSVSMQMTSLCIMLIYPLQVTLFPVLKKTHKLSNEKFLNTYKYFSSLCFLVGLIIVLIAYNLSPFLLNYFLANNYSEINNFFFIHCITILLMYLSTFRSTYITFENCGKLLFIIQLIVLLLNFFLNIYMIPKFGYIGASLSTLISTFLSLIISNLFFVKLRTVFTLQLTTLNILRVFYSAKSKT